MERELISYIVFSVLSLLVSIAGVIVGIISHRTRGKSKRIFSTLQRLTGFVFLALLFVHIPLNYYHGEFRYYPALLRCFNAFWVSVQDTLRVFILDGDFKDFAQAMKESLKSVNGFYAPFSVYTILLQVLAPVFTFGNVLSLFKNFNGELRILWHRKRPFYVMSELNECSLSIAKSIREKYDRDIAAYRLLKKERHLSKKEYLQTNPYALVYKPILVFTDVFEKDDEQNYDFKLKALDLNAICLKKDITGFDFSKRKNRVEFFIISEVDESENLSHVIKLTEKHKSKKNSAVYLYSSNPNSAVVLDSIEKGDLTLGQSLRTAIDRKPKEFLFRTDELLSNDRMDEGFYLRRIDAFEDLAISTLADSALITNCFPQLQQKSRMSILLIGLGEHGMVFLKTLLWIYQLYKVELEINIIDARSCQEVLQQLGYIMPEVCINSIDASGVSVSPFAPFEEDECSYTINLFAGMDSFSKRYTDLFKKDAQKADEMRTFSLIKRTQLVIVALGDDEKNIECSIRTRSLFDQLCERTKSDISRQIFNRTENANGEDEVTLNNEYEKPVILSIVYDEKKTENLSAAAGGLGITDTKSTPYHIRFIGNLSSMYSYDRIIEMKDAEMKAIRYHIEWIKNESILRRAYQDIHPANQEKLTYFRKRLLKERGENTSAAAGRKDTQASEYIPDKNWYDKDFYEQTEDKGIDFETPKAQPLIKEMEKFTKVEYFRKSSIAKAVHKNMITESFEEYICLQAEEIARQRTNDVPEDDQWSIFSDVYAHPCYREEGIAVCDCVQCTIRRVSEHMRWDMYMRTQGFVSANYRNDRAKVHGDIRPWHTLPFSEQYKD